MFRKEQSRVNLFDDSDLGEASRKIEKKRKIRSIVLVAATVLIIAAALFIVANIFCRVAVIEVSGTDVYTDNEIIETAGIKIGMKMFSVKKSEVSEKICHNLTGIETATVKFSLPNKIKIILTEGSPRYSFETGGKLYYISENFVALGTDLTVGAEDRIYMLGPDEIKRYISGSEIEMFDEDWLYIIKELTAALELNGLADKVTLIETADKFNIVVRYDSRIKIALGEYEDIDEKLEFVKSTIDSLDIDAVGTIRIKNYKMGSFLRGEY